MTAKQGENGTETRQRIADEDENAKMKSSEGLKTCCLNHNSKAALSAASIE